MRRNLTSAIALLAVLSLGGCRSYNAERHVASQGGLIPADQYARYGRQQAILMAVGREFARPYNSGPDAQAEVAITYARTHFSGDIEDISADPQGHRLVITFKTGWRAAVVPIDDGKTGDDTRIPA